MPLARQATLYVEFCVGHWLGRGNIDTRAARLGAALLEHAQSKGRAFDNVGAKAECRCVPHVVRGGFLMATQLARIMLQLHLPTLVLESHGRPMP